MTIYEKRAWLGRYHELMQIVEEETSKAGYWKEKADFLSAAKLDLSGIRSNHTTDLGALVAKFLDLAAECSKLAEEAELCKEEIISAIDQIEDQSCRMVLRYRYISFLPYPEIAKRMSYSTSRVFELHRKGLKLLRIPERP